MKKDIRKKYLIAVSGGPDSMALLNMYKDKYELIVCHINYHHRDTANRDEKIVKRYCKNNKIKFIKFDYVESGKGNFQDRARVFRYKCFADLINKYSLVGVLVGHHLDDLIETYLLQLDRKSNVTYWGLKKTSEIMGVKVFRPLMNKTKSQLEKYCIGHNIEYGIDESNLSDLYKRNRIRHSKIEKMSLSEKKEIVKEIRQKNLIEAKENKEVKKFIKNRYRFDYEEFINHPYIKKLLRNLISFDLSDKYLDEIISNLKGKNNLSMKIKNKYLFKEYGYVEIRDIPHPFKIIINKLEYKKYDYFKIEKKGKSSEGVSLSESDFPITIRNFKDGDRIQMRFGTKKISRYFIDRKISSYERLITPIVFNSKGTAVLVPGLGCDVAHYTKKHNAYVKIISYRGGKYHA